jgi:hypothetical protein
MRSSIKITTSIIGILLILAVAPDQMAQVRHPVRWNRAVGPPSRQALRAKLLKPPASEPRPDEIQSCADYLRALKEGRDGAQSADESFVAAECDPILLVLAAEPSRVSYVQGFKLDESALGLLPASVSFIADEDKDKVERKGLSWKRYHPKMKLLRKAFNEITVAEDDENGVNLRIMAFGDFNGDGVEDVLLSKENFEIEGHGRSYSAVILTRLSPGGRLKAFEVDDKAIQNAAAIVMRQSAGKPN